MDRAIDGYMFLFVFNQCWQYWEVIRFCCCYFSNSLSRSRSRSLTKKRPSRSRSPVREGSERRRSQSRGTPVKGDASKRGPHTPPGSPRQNSLTRKRRSLSRSPAREGSARDRSVSRSPVRNRTKSSSEHQNSRKGPHTPPGGSPQRNSRSKTPVGRQSGSPAADGNMKRGPRTPPTDGVVEGTGRSRDTARDGSSRSSKKEERSLHHSRQSSSPVKNRSHSPSPQHGSRRGPRTPPSPSAVQRSSRSRSPR